MLRDQIVFTVRSPKIHEKIINEGSDLTLEKAIDIARTYELSKQQLKTFSQFKLDVIKTKPNTSLKSYSGHSITPKYVVKTTCSLKTSTHDIQLYIVDIDAIPVLGAKTCSDLGLVKRMSSIQSNEN